MVDADQGLAGQYPPSYPATRQPHLSVTVVIDEETSARITAFWDASGDPDAWNFITTELHNGDCYYFLALLRAFRKFRSGGRRIRVLAVNRQHLALAALFADQIDQLEYTPNADFSGEQLSAWRVARNRGEFVPGILLNLFPLNYFPPPLDWGALWFLLTTRGLYFLHLFKLLLGLPIDIALDVPAVSASARRAALELSRQHDLIPGRTLILFPYGVSWPQGEQATRDHMAALAARATAGGLRVLTSIAGEEVPVPGTSGIFIPFGVLIPFCELAGYVVGLRSGISEVLATARCTKVYTYINQEAIDDNSVVAYGLGGAERGIVFDFDRHPDPPGFAETALARLLGPAPSDGSSCIPQKVRQLLNLTLSPAIPNGRFTAAEFIIRHDWGRIFTSGVLGDGWSGPEGDGIWTQGFRSVLYLKPAIPASFTAEALLGRSVILCIELAFAIAPDTHDVLDYSIEVNEDRSCHQARWPDNVRVFRIPLSLDVATAPLRLTIMVENPISLHDLANGRGGDGRIVGMRLMKAGYERDESDAAQ